MSEIITVNARKFDKTIYRSWQCELIRETEDFYLFYGKFEKEVAHAQLGIIRRNTASYEYYWKDEFYNVFKFYEPNGEFRNFYCNLNIPPTFSENVLDYVDLDIDVLVWKDFSIKILDLDEYENNARKYNYLPDLQEKVSHSLEKLLKKIQTRGFPFDTESPNFPICEKPQKI